MSTENLGLSDGVAGAVQNVISTFHLDAHDRVVNIRNTVQGVVDGGEYAGAGAAATTEKMQQLQQYWDKNLEPILTRLYQQVGGTAEALTNQDQLGANLVQAIEAGSGMTGNKDRLSS